MSSKTTSTKTSNKTPRARKPRANAAQVEIVETPATETPAHEQAFALVRDALNARLVHARDVEQSANKVREIKTTQACMNERAFSFAFAKLTQTDWAHVAKCIAQTDENPRDTFMSVKTLKKMGFVVRDIAQGIFPKQNNTRLVLLTMLKNNNYLTIAEMVAAQSRVFRENADLFDIRDEVESKGGYSPLTAGAQTGNIRGMLNLLGLADIQKQKRNDPGKLRDYAVELFNSLTLARQ